MNNTEQQNNSIKIVRMQSGEDIISSVMEDEQNEIVLLSNPMKLVIKRIPSGQSVFMMMPWLPVELIKDDAAIVYSADIMTVVEPKDALVEYYLDAIGNSEVLRMRQENEDDLYSYLSSLGEDDDEFDENELEITEEDMDALENYKKGNLLH